MLNNNSPETAQIEQIYTLVRQLAGSPNPVVHNLAVQMLGLSKLLVAEMLPDKFEHVSQYELLPEAGGSGQANRW